MRFVYLHGFGSSPLSRKAVFFKARLAERGIAVTVPELAPVFRKTCISDELAIAEALVTGDTVLFGSSLGGYLATLVASRHPETVRALVLFAPAFDVPQRWRDRIGDAELARWRRQGTMAFHNSTTGREEPLEYRFYEDALAHPPRPEVRCPALVFAGRMDTVVPLATIEPFAGGDRELVVLESDHELVDVMDEMWRGTWAFLRRTGAVNG